MYHLDLEIQTSPTLSIRSERLWTPRLSGPRRGIDIDYLKSDPPDPHSSDLQVRWQNERQGVNPPITMRATQLATSQASTRVPATTVAGRKVHEVADIVLAGISGIFILDPVPQLMREYADERDSILRRNAENLSATLKRLAADPQVQGTLLTMTESLSEAQVSSLTSVTSPLGDVMVTIEEMIGGAKRQVPARLMSDGTLRFLAIAAAILDEPATSPTDIDSGRIVVVEELENGLHPSQAALLLERLKLTAPERGIRTVATTHGPAILDALSGDDHNSVMVSTRDKQGWSRVDRLTDFPDYFEVVGQSSLGESAVRDRLRPGVPSAGTARAALSEIFG
jgi:hypothetical protein